MDVYVCVCAYVHMCLCVLVCVCLCMCAYVFVCSCMCVSVQFELHHILYCELSIYLSISINMLDTIYLFLVLFSLNGLFLIDINWRRQNNILFCFLSYHNNLYNHESWSSGFILWKASMSKSLGWLLEARNPHVHLMVHREWVEASQDIASRLT